MPWLPLGQDSHLPLPPRTAGCPSTEAVLTLGPILPLHRLFPMPGMPFPPLSAWQTSNFLHFSVHMSPPPAPYSPRQHPTHPVVTIPLLVCLPQQPGRGHLSVWGQCLCPFRSQCSCWAGTRRAGPGVFAERSILWVGKDRFILPVVQMGK